MFDRELGGRLEQSFDFRHVWSTAAIAAPWFVGAALGLEVRFSFYVGSHPFLIARLRVQTGGGLEGLAMSDLSARIRVIAIGRDGGAGGLEHPPRRDTRLAAGGRRPATMPTWPAPTRSCSTCSSASARAAVGELGGTPPQIGRPTCSAFSSVAMSSSSRVTSAAARFSSRCDTEVVPGISSIRS